MSTCGGDARQRKSSAGSHHRSESRLLDYVDEWEEAPPDETNGGEYVDEEKVENTMGTLTARGKTGRKKICHEPDEEDDGLMMYANLKALPHPPSPLASPFLMPSN